MMTLSVECTHRLNPQFELDVSFECGDGVTALFGPSGSGKTTVLNIIAGVLKPAAGRILLGSRVLVDTGQGAWLAPERREIATVSQDHLLFPHLSVRRNLLYGAQRGVGAAQDLEKISRILEIDGLLDRYPHSLSGGQRQRVALGRAILRRPQMLLMDEPLAALDEPLKQRLLDYLERLLEEYRLPTLFVSHAQTDVRRLAEQVIIVDGGRVVDAGPARPTLDRVLLRGPAPISPMNLVAIPRVRLVNGRAEGRIGEQPFAFIASNGDLPASALVQFLPSDVILSRDVVAGISVRNQLRGIVRDIVHARDRAFVAVDVGQLIWAEVTHEVVVELGIQPGATIVCLIKATAARAIASKSG